jgi:hypothetical protein
MFLPTCPRGEENKPVTKIGQSHADGLDSDDNRCQEKNMTHAFHQTKHWAAMAALLASLLCAVTAQAQGSVRPDVHKPLSAAQEALKNNQIDAALKLAADALAVPELTVVERIAILRTRAVAATRAQNWDLVIESLEPLVVQADITAADKRSMLETLVSASQQKKDYPRLVKWARQYLQDGGTNASMRTVMIQVLAVTGQHAEVVKEMQEKMRLDDAAGKTTPEEELRMLAVSYRNLKDNAGYQATLRKLLINHPSKAYWSETISRLAQAPGLNQRLELDLYRLLEESGNLEESDEFTDMAQMALRAGLPAEALRVLNNGYDKGALGKGADAAAHAKLKTEAQKKAQEDDKLFAQLEKSAKDGNALAGVGDVNASKQNWAAANAAYAQALAAGGLRREQEFRLHYAIGLIKAGQKEQALAQLKAVQGDATAVEIAALWQLLAR